MSEAGHMARDLGPLIDRLVAQLDASLASAIFRDGELRWCCHCVVVDLRRLGVRGVPASRQLARRVFVPASGVVTSREVVSAVLASLSGQEDRLRRLASENRGGHD